MSKILLVANSSWYFYNFRLPLIMEILNRGYKVTLVCPFDKYTEKLRKNNFKVINWRVKRSSINPFNELISLLNLTNIYKEEKPDIIHHFTIKACLYGTFAARYIGIRNVINAVTGLGYIFLARGVRNSIFRFFMKYIYKFIFKSKGLTVIFQNCDDLEKLVNLNIVDSESSLVIRGSGVDVDFFDPSKFNPRNLDHNSTLKLLFPSRLIYQKGLKELLNACESLWALGECFELWLAGEIDDDSKSVLTKEDHFSLINNKNIRFLGHVEDMRFLYHQCDIVVLPSWREGLSRSLAEAASMEKPIITSNVPGCRDIVDHGVSGLLVNPKDSKSIEFAILLLMRNKDLAKKMGIMARLKIKSCFGVSIINQKTIDQYKNLLQYNHKV